MDGLDVFTQLEAIEYTPDYPAMLESNKEWAQRIASHKVWLQRIRHERPNVTHPFRIGVYIRYFNQTKYDNYLSFHKKQFSDSIGLCPQWTLVDFYVDEGSSTPNMENAPEWSRLLEDSMNGKVDLIITQKVSNVSKNMDEITFCARMLASQEPPIGIYFISEDIFTLASYYLEDMKDPYFLPGDDWVVLPDEYLLEDIQEDD